MGNSGYLEVKASQAIDGIVISFDMSGLYKDRETGMTLRVMHEGEKASFQCFNTDGSLFTEEYDCIVGKYDVAGETWSIARNVDGTLCLFSTADDFWGYFSKIEENEMVGEETKSESLLYALLEDAWRYAGENNIPLTNFIERKAVCDFLREDSLQTVIDNTIFVEEDCDLHLTKDDTVQYKKTIEETKLLYYGELNADAKPDGLGIVFEIDTFWDYQNPDVFIRYMGYFENGEYDGYGVEFEIDDIDDVPNKISWETLENNKNLLNPVVYEGYFKDGYRCGKGIAYVNNFWGYAIKTGETGRIDPALLTYSFDIGEYEDNELDGEVKMYKGSRLIYEGGMKNGKYNGYGKEYSWDTGILTYEGEFKNDSYHGKGTLYNENGEIVHKGEFRGGDVK